jgi:indole-3-acetate monooxygenase
MSEFVAEHSQRYFERIKWLAPTVCEHADRAEREAQMPREIADFYQCHDEVWRKGEAGDSFSLQDRALMRLGNVTAAKLALQAVDLVADAAGMNSAHTSCPIERCWRDVHTAMQHVLLNTARFEVIGRVLFGLEPGSPVI